MTGVQTPSRPPVETPPPRDVVGYQAVLQNRNFLALWLGQIFSQVADRIIFVVFVALIVHYFGPSDRYNSYLYIAFTIPAILLTAIAGVFVDRWPRRATLVLTNLLRAACVMLLPLAEAGGSAPWLLFAMAFLISVATQFFVPAEAATIPTIVPKNHLMMANSLFTTTMMASVIFGFALGDPLINIFTLKQVHWAIAGLFLASSACLMFVRTPAACIITARGTTFAETCRSLWAEMQDGLHYIRDHAMVRNAIVKLAVLFSGVIAVCILLIAYAKAYLFSDPLVASRKFAYIIAFSGIGMAIGAAWVGTTFQHARRGFLVFSGFLVIGAGLLLLSCVEWLPQEQYILATPRVVTPYVYLDAFHLTSRMLLTYGVASVMGVAAAFVAIPLQSLIHELIPEDKRGKVLGVQFTLLSTCSTLPVLAAGVGVEYIGVKAMLLLIGLPIVGLGALGLVQRIRQMRASHVFAADW